MLRPDRAGAEAFAPHRNLVFWSVAEIGAGWTTAKIAKRRQPVWVLAALVGSYLAGLHLALKWPRFPWWYNLGVVIPAVPAVLLGGRLASRGPNLSLA